MARCPYIYVTSGAVRPCIYNENEVHIHAYLTPYTDIQHGSPTGWKLPQGFRGTALIPAVVESGNYRAMSRAKHAHSRDERCLKNTFVHPEDCPVVEKTDSEKQPCDYEYHRLSNHVGRVEKFPCVGKLGHEEKSGSHRYDLGDGIKREGHVSSAWHKKEHESCPEEPCNYTYRITAPNRVPMSRPCLVKGKHTQHLYRAWDGFLVSGVTPESWVEKTDSEKNSVARVETHYRVVLKVRTPSGEVITRILRGFRTEEVALEAIKSTSLHVLSAEIQKRTVTTIETDWEALG